MTTIHGHVNLSEIEHKTTPVPRYSASQTGYGSKIPTRHLVRLPFDGRWRRVYVTCYSNSGTAWVKWLGGWCVVRS